MSRNSTTTERCGYVLSAKTMNFYFVIVSVTALNYVF